MLIPWRAFHGHPTSKLLPTTLLHGGWMRSECASWYVYCYTVCIWASTCVSSRGPVVPPESVMARVPADQSQTIIQLHASQDAENCGLIMM